MHISRLTSLIGIAFLSSILLVLHVMAHEFFFYWTIWWYDILMHGLGGMVVGATAMWILAFLLPPTIRIGALLWVFLFSLGVGVLWELFEYVIGSHAYLSGYGSYALDTVGDVGMDIVGSFVAFIFFRRFTHE